VARILHEEDFESDCLVTSLNYDALQEAKNYNPRLRTGLIVAHALGDLSRMEVGVLSVRADFLSDEVLRAAHRHGREVHVWTVNDPSQMTRQMMRGVDNLITSDPDLAVRVRDEWAGMTGTERLVLASRLLLGLNP
jgi:glycerophosphoryl diester phosphodiesterase